jgi:hypothetical protein
MLASQPSASVCNAVDREADAIDRDRALVGQVARQVGGRQHAQLPALAHLGEVGDPAYAVHMARNQVATQAVVGAQGFFQVDGPGSARPGLVQRLGRDVDGEAPVLWQPCW